MLKLQLLDQNQEFIYSVKSTSTGLLALKQGKLHLGARSVEVRERRWCCGEGIGLPAFSCSSKGEADVP